MAIKYTALCILYPLVALYSLSITPNPAIEITSDTSVVSPVPLAGNSQGFIASWISSNTGTLYTAKTANNGVSWSTPAPLPVANTPLSMPWIAANDTGFVVIWADNNGDLKAVFTSDFGVSWSSAAVITSSGNIAPPPTITASSSGFLITWWQTNNSIQSSFSTNGTTWTAPSQAYQNNTNVPQTFPIAACSGNDCLVAWQGYLNTGYSSFSSNDGTSWASDIAIASTDIGLQDPIWASFYGSAYVCCWQNGAGGAYASTSIDNGSSWSVPVNFATGVSSASNPLVAVLGAQEGFFATAYFNDNSGRISYSTDNGATWSSFTSVTGSYPMGSFVGSPFLSIAQNTSGLMTTWLDANGNAAAAFIPISLAPETPSSLSGSGLTNTFPLQIQSYISLSWSASASTNVIGYHVYRDGNLLASTTDLFYQDNDVTAGTSYIYSVTAYTANAESATISAPVQAP